MVVVPRVGVRRDIGRDLYHFLRTARWPTLLGSIVLVFLLGNAVFALLYLASPGSIVNAHAGSFEDAFFFSVQTMATIGYGGMTPVGRWANVLATGEAVFGIILTAMSTGILFAKFSSPKPRVLFSRDAVITKENGKLTLMFRMGNERLSHLIVEAEIRVTFIHDVIESDGSLSRRLAARSSAWTRRRCKPTTPRS
jgi:inward rectifier potassium channel